MNAPGDSQDGAAAAGRPAVHGLDAVLGPVSDGVFRVDRDFVYTYLNEAGARLVGRTPESLMGRCMWDEFPEARGSIFEERYRQALATQQVIEFEEEFAPLEAVFAIRVFPSDTGLTIIYQDVTAAARARADADAETRQWLQQAEHATDVAFRMDASGVMVWCSPGVEPLLGYRPDEVRGRAGLSFVHPEDVETATAALDAVRDTSTAAPRMRVLAKDGTVRWVEVTSTLIRDGDRPVMVVGGWRDVTAEQVALAALRDSENRYRLLAENASDIVYESGTDHLIRWIAPTVERSLGWAPSELVGTTFNDLIHPDDLPTTTPLRERLYSGGEVTSASEPALMRVRASDGTYRWFAGRAHPLTAADGTPTGIVAGLQAVDDVVTARNAAQANEDRLRATLDSMIDPNVTFEAVRDPSGAIVDFAFTRANSAAVEQITDGTGPLVGGRLLDIDPGHRSAGVLDMYAHVVDTGEVLILDDFQFPEEIQPLPRYYDLRAVKLGDGLIVTWRDVTARHDAVQLIADSEERYRLLAENSSDVVMRTRDNAVIWVSPSLTTALGWDPADWVGHSLAEFGKAEDHPVVLAAQDQLRHGGSAVMQIRFADVAGEWHWVEAHSQVYRDSHGQADGYLTSFRVVDTEVEAQGLLERRATYDDLTGTLKRDVALARLHDIGQHPRTPGRETAVLFIDVDAFKQVNDTYGHAAGDALLRRYADVIHGSVRTGDTVARVGGDEFLVILTGLHAIGEATAIAEKIRVACAAPLELREGIITSTVSIGVTLSLPIESGDEMIARADDAMYRAKASGRNQVITVT